MKQLHCPFCGERELEEFVFRKTVADSDTDAVAAVYARVNRPDLSVEHWQHAHGCRSWLLVKRNPSTGAVLQCEVVT